MVIINKDQLDAELQNTPTTAPGDEPPSYITATAGSSSSSRPALVTSRSSTFPLEKPLPAPTPTSPSARAGPSSSRGAGPSSPTPTPAGWLATLLGTPQAKQDAEVRQTVLGLFQGIIKQGDSTNAVSIMQSCMDACRTRGLSFESIVQEPSIQGHTPLYWTIVKNVYSERAPAGNFVTLFDILTSFPLTPTTYADALSACLLTSSHEMFLRLKEHNPAPKPHIPSNDEVLNSDDSIVVTNGEDVEAALNGAFKVDINIKDFQKRMRLFKDISIEFIARGRMWALSFVAYDPAIHFRHHWKVRHELQQGQWLLLLDLLQNSPATWLDSRVTIGAPGPPAARPQSPAPAASEAPTTSRPFPFSLPTASSSSKPAAVIPIVFRLRSPGQQQMTGEARGRRGMVAWEDDRGQIMTVLSEHAHGSSLEFDGCPYILPDGSLRILFEAKLVKPGNAPDCVFM